MAHVRGHPSDFDNWVALGCAGWGFDDLLPYFIRSESSQFGATPLHGADGPLKLMQPDNPHPLTQCYMAAAQSLGCPPISEHNGLSMSGPTLNTLTIVDGKRLSGADAYLTPVMARKNLNVIDRCFVKKLLLDKTDRCYGVVYQRDDELHELNADGTVIVCAGAIGTPQLLMCSGIGPADSLQALQIDVKVDIPGVGQNLHDHLLSGGNVYRSKKTVPVTNYQHSESLLYVNRDNSNPAPEMMFACVVLPVVTERFSAPEPGYAYTIMYGVPSPRSRGRISLQSADPNIAPLIDPKYLSDPYDRDVFVEALDFARELGSCANFAEWRDHEILPGNGVNSLAEKQAFNAQVAFTHHHPVGTCRMGVGDDAVVSPELAISGTDNLYVVDASVIPAITTGPVNAAVVAIAEKASDLLRDRKPLRMDNS